MLKITQLGGLCCVEDTTAKLVYCDSFLPIKSVTLQFSHEGKKKGATTKTCLFSSRRMQPDS